MQRIQSRVTGQRSIQTKPPMNTGMGDTMPARGNWHTPEPKRKPAGIIEA